MKLEKLEEKADKKKKRDLNFEEISDASLISSRGA
jgi:Dynamin GTPase effector domain